MSVKWAIGIIVVATLIVARICYLYGAMYDTYVDYGAMLAYWFVVVVVAVRFDWEEIPLMPYVVAFFCIFSAIGFGYVGSLQKAGVSEKYINVSEGTTKAHVVRVDWSSFDGPDASIDPGFHPYSVVYKYRVSGEDYIERDYFEARTVKKGDVVPIMYLLGRPAVSKIIKPKSN